MEAAGIHSVELIFLLLLLFVAGLAALAKRFATPVPDHPRHRRPDSQSLPAHSARRAESRRRFSRYPAAASFFFCVCHLLARLPLQPCQYLHARLRPRHIHGSRRRPRLAVDSSRFRLPPRARSRCRRQHHRRYRRRLHRRATRFAQAPHDHHRRRKPRQRRERPPRPRIRGRSRRLGEHSRSRSYAPSA